MAITDANPLSAALEAIAEGIVTALLGWLQQQANTPDVMIDAKADPGVQSELQNDLQNQIAAGIGKLP